MTISKNIGKLEKEIGQICTASGRKPSEVRLVAISKTKPVEMIREAFKAGIRDFGENYINEVMEKAEFLKDIDIKWHFVGSVQTNKVKYLTRFCSLLHSMDRIELAEALQKRLEFEDKTMEVLIQVNTSGEATKSGMAPHLTVDFARHISAFDRIKVKGLMTIAENSGGEVEIRKNFRDLKRLYEEIKVLDIPGFEMEHLSMGMSGDYKIAVEEGATILRIGSSIFGKRS